MEFAVDWIQKFIFPLRYPNIVPVMVVDGVSEEEEYLEDIVSWSSTMVVQLQVGISSCMRERSNLHDLTCLWQSTVVTPVAMLLVAMLNN